VVLVLLTAGVFAAVTYRGTPMSVTTLTEGWEPRFKLDDKGGVVERRIWAIPGGVGGGQRAYFEVPGLPAAHEYRVYVWDYSLTQS
jgi:hypothetical protein